MPIKINERKLMFNFFKKEEDQGLSLNGLAQESIERLEQQFKKGQTVFYLGKEVYIVGFGKWIFSLHTPSVLYSGLKLKWIDNNGRVVEHFIYLENINALISITKEKK